MWVSVSCHRFLLLFHVIAPYPATCRFADDTYSLVACTTRLSFLALQSVFVRHEPPRPLGEVSVLTLCHWVFPYNATG